MKVDDVKQHVVDRFKVPIDEVEEAAKQFDFMLADIDVPIGIATCIYSARKNLKQKIDNLKALIPTIQSRKG